MAEHDSLYVPQAFREHDVATLFDIVERHNFAPLVTPSSDGLSVSHVPFYLARDRGTHPVKDTLPIPRTSWDRRYPA